MGPDHADLVCKHPNDGVALEPVLSQHEERPWLRVLVPDRLGDHQGVGRDCPGMICDQKCSTTRGNVLDSLALDSKPVLVVEVEDWLNQGVEALRASPIVDIPRGIGSWEEAVKISAHRYGRLVGGHRVEVGVRLVPF